MSTATLNGLPALAARVSMPAWGLWWAEVECSGPEVLAGPVTLAFDGLTLIGTIVTAGAYQTRTRYRIVAGAGGWGRTIAAKSYSNDLGVKASLVLRDAALACGETIGVAPVGNVGPAFVRAEGPASRVLDALAPRGWYVDDAGLTHIGRRPAATFTGAASRMVNDAAQVRYELAPDAMQLGSLLPGVVVDGVEAVDVEHVLDAAGVRTTLWGRGIADTSRLSEALRRIVEGITAGSRWHAVWEYRVVQKASGSGGAEPWPTMGDLLDLQIVRVSTGMPDLRRVRVRPGVAGMRSHPPLGSRVLVAFVNGDPGRPMVVGFDEQDGPGAVADDIAIRAGSTGTHNYEHATSAEATTHLLATSLDTLASGLGAPPGTGTTAVIAAITACTAGAMGGGVKTALDAALAAKTANTTGSKPGLGWPAVRGG